MPSPLTSPTSRARCDSSRGRPRGVDPELAVAQVVGDRGPAPWPPKTMSSFPSPSKSPDVRRAVGGAEGVGVVPLRLPLRSPAPGARVVPVETEDAEEIARETRGRRDDLRAPLPEHVPEREVLAPDPGAREPGGDLLEAKRVLRDPRRHDLGLFRRNLEDGRQVLSPRRWASAGRPSAQPEPRRTSSPCPPGRSGPRRTLTMRAPELPVLCVVEAVPSGRSSATCRFRRP